MSSDRNSIMAIFSSSKTRAAFGRYEVNLEVAVIDWVRIASGQLILVIDLVIDSKDCVLLRLDCKCRHSGED